MAFLHSTSLAAKLLITFLIFYSLFITFGKARFYRDPGSIFFDQNRAYERQYSALRLQEVEQARARFQIEHYGGKAAVSSHQGDVVPEMCVGMTTINRPGLRRQYIEDALVSMLDGLTAEERTSIHISLLFTVRELTSHPTMEQKWLLSMVDDVWSYHNYSGPLFQELRLWLNNATRTGKVPDDMRIKASMDYTLALERCLTYTSAPYIAVFEGDILVSPGWVATTLEALRGAEKLIRQAANSWIAETRYAVDWLDMRLFNQERSTGWSSRRIGGNNEFIIVLILNTVVLILTIISGRRHKVYHRHFDLATLTVISLIIIPLSTVTFFQAGKASLFPPRPGLAIENFGCCSQALIFNRKHVPQLIEYLRNFVIDELEGKEMHMGYDMRTRDFAARAGLDRLALYPVQVQHMGVRSGIGTVEVEARQVWSMAFESLQPEDIKQRHERGMEKVFGHKMDKKRAERKIQ